MVREPQVVVRAEAENRSAVELDLGALWAVDPQWATKEPRHLQLAEGLPDLFPKPHHAGSKPSGTEGSNRVATEGTAAVARATLHVQHSAVVLASELQVRSWIRLESLLNGLERLLHLAGSPLRKHYFEVGDQVPTCLFLSPDPLSADPQLGSVL